VFFDILNMVCEEAKVRQEGQGKVTPPRTLFNRSKWFDIGKAPQEWRAP
jgi:hypothetical protein